MPRRALTEPYYNAKPQPPPPPPPPPPPRNSGCKTALRLTALALLLATLAVVAGGLLGAPGAGEASSHWTDYDDNNNGLIDVRNLAQLNAIRHDLNGNGDATHADYVAAFPNRDTSGGGRMGCPSGACTGYELRANLDYDTNGNGYVDTGDDYPNWTPLGTNANPYTTTFNGNGHTIANLTINASNVAPVGLFAAASSGAPVIENVGLIDVNITASHSGGGFFTVGGLVGFLRGTVRTSYVTGTISTSATGNSATSVGGIAGWMGHSGVGSAPASQLDASWSAVDVALSSASTSATPDAAGSLVGRMASNNATPTGLNASYATGTVTGGRSGTNIGGLVGRMVGTRTTVTASYWDTETSRLSSGGGGTGQTTTALQSPTDYGASAGDTFFGWNIDLDGQAGGDDPWDFGTSSQYPALKQGGHQLVPQRRMPTDLRRRR